MPIFKTTFEDKEITYQSPLGNTFVETKKIIRVRKREIVGYRTIYPPKPPAPGPNSPKRRGYHLTESFGNPHLTSVEQREIFGTILQHQPLQGGWEVEATKGISKSPRVGTKIKGIGPWNAFFASAPKGDLMASIGEIGFCHSGLLGRPIELTKKKTRLKVPRVGSPYFGLPPSTLLDLLTPGAFRKNSTGQRYAEDQWRSGRGENTHENPRRGTWNINSVPASDTYMAMRESKGQLHNTARQSSTLGQLNLHPVWAPNGHGLRRSWGTDRGSLDPMMSPFPRYRRGFESWLSVMVGDYTPFRSRGEAIWGRVEWGSAYAVLSAPWFSWRVGSGGATDPQAPTVSFDPDFTGASSSLLAMGRISTNARNPNNRRQGTKSGATGLFYSDQNYIPSRAYRDPGMSLASIARVGNFALRHHNSEMISVSSQDITKLHTALNPQHSSVGWTKVGGGAHRQRNVTAGFLGKYATYFQPYRGFGVTRINNGHPGNYTGTGIYANAPVVLSANQVSTSANVFTAHIVTQAIKDSGSERDDYSVPMENTNTGLGYMDFDDKVVGEQWTQVVIARIPGEGYDEETGGPQYDYKILYSRPLNNGR